MNWFILAGGLAFAIGLALMVTGIRKHREQHPKHIAMLIGGMMITAFGLVFAGFAIAYQNAAPLDLNSGATQ